MEKLQMNALVFDRAGEASEVLSVKKIPVPVAKAGQVLVRILAAPVNPSDYFFINGTYRFKPVFPQTAGLEGAGIVEETNGVVGIEPGTLVSFFAGESWAEYAAVSKDNLHVLPPGFPIEKAAQFALNGFTAWGLIERAAVNAGDWLLVTAANAAVSKLVVQICKHRGIHVIAVARKEFYRAELMQYGAVAMIDSTKESIEEQVRTITAGNGVHAVIDAVGGNTGTECIRAIATNGRLIIYGRLSDKPAQFYNADIVYKNISINGFGIRTYYKSKTTAQQQEITQALSDLLSLTSVKMEIAGSYKLHAYKEALQISGDETSGKRLFTPGDGKK